MTRKVLLFLFSFILAAGNLRAQIDFGLRAGVNLPGMTVEEFSNSMTYQDPRSLEREFGYHGGLFANIEIGSYFIQPEALFTNINQLLTVDDVQGGTENIDIQFSRFDLPILVGKKLGPVRLFVGPIYSVNIASAEAALEEGALEEGTFGWQGGIGLKIGPVIIDARYEGPLTSTAKAVFIENTSYETDLRINQIVIGLGYVL